MKKPTTRRIWVFRIVTMVLSPVVFLLLLEGVLRLFSYGDSTAFFVPVTDQEKVTGNPRYTYPYFPKQLVREPDMFRMDKNKPEGTYRIFVMGGSAARGTPDPRFGFGRILEVILQEAYPDRQFEVVNTGMVAINSHVVLRIAEECADYEPDLFVVYMGNNEVVGPFGATPIFGRSVPSRTTIALSINARSSRIGQLATNIMEKLRDKSAQPEWLGMEMFLEHGVPTEDPRLEAVYRHFEANLRDIEEVAEDADVPLLLCTVPVNLRNCAPLASDHSPDLSDDDLKQWQKLYDEGAVLEAEEQWAKAEERYASAAELDDMYADLHFRRARCALALGNYQAAHRHYETARDLDSLRFRAASKINETIRNVGESEAVSLIDIEKQFKQLPQVPHGIPGEELFYEHVHLNFQGNYELARMVYEETTRQLEETPSKAIPSLEECKKLLGFSKLDEFQMASSMMNLIVQPPFTNQLDYYERCEKLHAKIRSLREHSKSKGLEEAERLLNEALTSRPYSLHSRVALTQIHLKQKKGSQAESKARELLEQLPDRAEFHALLARALLIQRKTDKAEEMFDKSIALASQPAEYMVHAATMFEQAGDTDRANELFREVLETHPGSGKKHNEFGKIYLNRKDYGQALELLERADSLQPGYGNILFNLSRAHFERGDLDNAAKHLRDTLEAIPFHLGAQMHLGLILKKQGHNSEAIKHLAETVQQEPEKLTVRLHLAEARVGLGQFDKAESGYRHVMKQAPDKIEAVLGLAWSLAIRADTTPEEQAEAVALAEKALDGTGGNSAIALDVLAAACATAGRFGEARTYAGHAITLAKNMGNTDLAKAIAERRLLYTESKPYRLPVNQGE